MQEKIVPYLGQHGVSTSSSGLRNRLCLFSTLSLLDSARSLLFSIKLNDHLSAPGSLQLKVLWCLCLRNKRNRTMEDVWVFVKRSRFYRCRISKFWFLGTSHSHGSWSDIIDGSVVGLQSVDITFSDRLGSLVISAEQVLKKYLVPGTATWSETLASNTNGPEAIRC